MYFFLSVIYLLVAFIAGKSASNAKTPKGYWRCLILPIIVFSVLYGCREGWMIDYVLYEDEYKALLRSNEKGKLGYLLFFLFKCGAVNGLSYNVILTFLNFSLIVCFCWITYYYKKYAHWILPLFYFVSRMTANFIAFYPAIGAMCLFMVLHLRADNKFHILKLRQGGLVLPLLFLLIAFGYHPAVIIAIIFYIGVLLIKIKPIYAIAIYAISFGFKAEFWLEIMNYASLYLRMFTENDTISAYNNYAENAESFYATHLLKGRIAPIFFYVRNFIANSSALYLYYKYTQTHNMNVAKTKILELCTIALVLTNMTEGVELLHRYAMLFRTFLPILYSYAVAQGFYSHKHQDRIMAILIILLVGQYFVSDAFFAAAEDGYNRLYIWD